MQVEVVKIGQYDPTLQGKYSLYDGFVQSASLQTQPDLIPETYPKLHQTAEDITGKRILHSTLRRGVETAEYLSTVTGIPTEPLELLNEIPFALDAMVTEEEFADQGSTLVRQRFLEDFAADTLLENRASIEARVKGVTALLEHAQDLPDAVVLVSHSFFMKVLQAYIEGYDVFGHPEELANVLPIDRNTFGYGEGFTFNARRDQA